MRTLRAGLLGGSRAVENERTLVPTNDIWIAAFVVQHDLYLFARDRHFDCLPQLARV